MLLIIDDKEDSINLESKILTAAFKQSVEVGDEEGLRLAHTELCKLLVGSEAPSQMSFEPVDGAVTLDACLSEPYAALSSQLIKGRPLPAPGSNNYYERLAASPTDTSFLLRVCYMRAVRLLLRQQYLLGKSQSINIHDFRRQLRDIGIAYHLLNDPASRADYDLRLLGLRNPKSGQGLVVPECAKVPDDGGKVCLSWEELLTLSRAFTSSEAVIAPDQYSDLDEDDFYAYLQGSELLSGIDFDSLALGYKLICHGLVTVVQFEQAFQALSKQEIGLLAVLSERAWLDEEAYNELFFAHSEENNRETFKIVEVAVADTPVLPQLNQSSALPSWASEMDWEENPEPSLESVDLPAKAKEDKPKKAKGVRPAKRGRKKQ